MPFHRPVFYDLPLPRTSSAFYQCEFHAWMKGRAIGTEEENITSLSKYKPF
jgi:hypothetical protein